MEDEYLAPVARSPPVSTASFSSDVLACEDGEESDGESAILRRTARFGIQLLEQTRELQDENAALRAQLEVLQQLDAETNFQSHLEDKTHELDALKTERRQNYMELSELRTNLAAKTRYVEELLERQTRMEQSIAEYKRRAAQLMEENERLQEQNKENAVVMPSMRRFQSEHLIRKGSLADLKNEEEYAELTQRYDRVVDEKARLEREKKSVAKENEGLKRRLQMQEEAASYISHLEAKVSRVQELNEELEAEAKESQAMIESLTNMNYKYKELLEVPNGSQPSSPTAAIDSSETSVQDVLIESNLTLELQIKELRSALASSEILGRKEPEEPEEIGNQASKTETSMEEPEPIDNQASDLEKLMDDYRLLQKQHQLTRDILRQTKSEWSAAVVSQKALEAHVQQLKQEVDDLQQTRLESAVAVGLEEKSKETWKQVEGYPSLPVDLTSPLIKNFVANWSAGDSKKRMELTDFLHRVLRGTGKKDAFRVDGVEENVCAGFLQLLVPVLRDQYGVNVDVYKRESMQVKTDLILKVQ